MLGGGGGGGRGHENRAGPGGDGGASSVDIVSVSAGTIYPVTVGLSGPPDQGEINSTGGRSSFANQIFANAGAGRADQCCRVFKRRYRIKHDWSRA